MRSIFLHLLIMHVAHLACAGCLILRTSLAHRKENENEICFPRGPPQLTKEFFLLLLQKFTRRWDWARSRRRAGQGAVAVGYVSADVRWRGGVDAELARPVDVLLLDVPLLHLQQPDDAAARIVAERAARAREPVDEV
jgi:hypothetical protein